MASCNDICIKCHAKFLSLMQMQKGLITYLRRLAARSDALDRSQSCISLQNGECLQGCCSWELMEPAWQDLGPMKPLPACWRQHGLA